MKTTALIATLIITAASATAFAADAPDTTRGEAADSASTTAQSQPAAGLTREQVRAALFEARSKGEVPETEADMDVAQTRKHQAQNR
ncbi:DUF4148 domain-containing protein [Duganella sp. FT3S]|uniref:DUF4148 domain-containing protein n=1 Tax=Rugamonas fusca TaxID=2758568 RepID=A0A7W2EJV5_9BURK|nr:DUF4148 domain-containing protein [Rugamonas fusca]MBA5607253.1 DUF4148 domain-containing protein [Rugamonas fusca]